MFLGEESNPASFYRGVVPRAVKQRADTASCIDDSQNSSVMSCCFPVVILKYQHQWLEEPTGDISLF